MSILSDKDRELLKGKFEAELEGEVEIAYFTQGESGMAVPGLECRECKETHELLQDVVALSPKLVLETLDFVDQRDRAAALGVDKIPATVLGEGGRVRFFGTLSGYEFATFVEDIISISKGVSGLSPVLQERLEGITRPTHIQVFVTPT